MTIGRSGPYQLAWYVDCASACNNRQWTISVTCVSSDCGNGVSYQITGQLTLPTQKGVQPSHNGYYLYAGTWSVGFNCGGGNCDTFQPGGPNWQVTIEWYYPAN